MTEEIKERIEQIKAGRVPEGYKTNKYVGIAPSNWNLGTLSDILRNKQRATPKPSTAYWRLGLRSFAKGTFHEFVKDPGKIDMDELYIVKKDDLIVNITFAWEHAIALASEDDDGLLVSYRFPTYEFKRGYLPQYYQYVVTQKRFKEMLSHISPGGAGRNRVMSKEDFLKLPCYIPPLPEQKKIAEILMQCDKVIELKQSKIEELQKLKKTCLSKMFPKEGHNVPELRFPGFTGVWEQRKLGAVCAEFKSGDFIRAKDIGVAGAYPVFGGNGLRGYTDRHNHDGDYALIGRQGALCGNMNYSSGKAYFTEHAVAVKANTLNETLFLFYRLGTMNLGQYSGQSAQPGLAVGNLVELETMLPLKEEQRQISVYFYNLDHLITLHQRELEETRKYKKVLMQLLLMGIVRVQQ